MGNMIIGLGNTGNQIVKEIASRPCMSDVKLYTIDSVASSADIDHQNVTAIPIISDDKCGSGRDRERGAAMFRYHEDQGSFVDMYADAEKAKSPVFVITSSAGGTGSGSVVPLCKTLIENDIAVVPIIICPAMDDPDAYHLNTNDLFIELTQVGIETYNIFRNRSGDTNYDPVNREVADMIEIVLGKRYGGEFTNKSDTIDEQDLDSIMSVPGRFVAISAKAPTIQKLTREITSKLFTGFQPAWTDAAAHELTFVTAYSLKSIFAADDFKTVFDEVRERTNRIFDEYKHIEQCDNDGICEATVIVAGLPRPDVKNIDDNYADVGGLAEHLNRSKRPNFMKRKRASITETKGENGDVMKQFNWKK